LLQFEAGERPKRGLGNGEEKMESSGNARESINTHLSLLIHQNQATTQCALILITIASFSSLDWPKKPLHFLY